MKQIIKFRLLSVTCLLTLLFCPLHADDVATLTIHFVDGTSSDIQLYTRPRVTFEGESVVFKSPVAMYSYRAQDVLRFTYSGIADAIITPMSDSSYHQEAGQIIFDDKVSPSDVMLFSEDGKRMLVSLSKVNGRASLSLSSLPKGVYLLSVNGRTSKIMKP